MRSLGAPARTRPPCREPEGHVISGRRLPPLAAPRSSTRAPARSRWPRGGRAWHKALPHPGHRSQYQHVRAQPSCSPPRAREPRRRLSRRSASFTPGSATAPPRGGRWHGGDASAPALRMEELVPAHARRILEPARGAPVRHEGPLLPDGSRPNRRRRAADMNDPDHHRGRASADVR